MDYEMKYNEALSQARFYYGNCPTEPEKKKLENIFPELRESEGEKIFREIYSIVHHCYQDRIDNLVGPERKKEQLDKWEKAKAWLEKQKEQKLKEAVEVEGVVVWQYLDNHGIDFYRVETNDFTTHGEICDGDKVKVIIVKED